MNALHTQKNANYANRIMQFGTQFKKNVAMILWYHLCDEFFPPALIKYKTVKLFYKSWFAPNTWRSWRAKPTRAKNKQFSSPSKNAVNFYLTFYLYLAELSWNMSTKDLILALIRLIRVVSLRQMTEENSKIQKVLDVTY